MSEPWLSGPVEGVHPLVAPLIHSFTQVREDAAHWTEGLSVEQLWAEPSGAGSVGFHVRHAGGAAERLCAYLLGKALNEAQVAAAKAEKTGGATRQELLAELNARLDAVEAAVTGLPPRLLHGTARRGKEAAAHDRDGHHRPHHRAYAASHRRGHRDVQMGTRGLTGR